MKRNSHIIKVMILLLSITAIGCNNTPQQLSQHKWPILNREFDNCVDRLEDAYIGDSCVSVIDALTDSLTYYSNHAKVGSLNKKQLENRVMYWKARAADRHDLPHEEIASITSAIENTDSVRFAYDYNRFKLCKFKSDPDIYQKSSSLVTLTSFEKYFKNHGDSASLANVYVNLSNLYRTWNYNDEAADYLQKATQLYTSIHDDVSATKVKLNLANIFSQTDRTDKAILILDSLRKDSIALNSPDFYNTVLRNSYILTGHAPYLKQAYRMIYDKEGYDNDKTLCLSHLIKISFSQNQPDSALYYTQTGISGLEQCSDLEYKSKFLFAAAQTYEKLGDTLKAYKFFKQGIETYAQHADTRRATFLTLAKQSKTNAIQEGRNEIDRIRYVNRTRLIIILLTVLLCIVVAYLIFRIRLQRHREKQKQLEYERDSNQLKLESVALVTQEKENVINSIGKMIENLRKSNSISDDSAREISNAIKIHIKSEDDRKLFQNLHDLIKPEFSNRLRQEFPALSDNNIRFLSYIAIGLSNKEIARIMMINHQSVNNNRHRLKKKLGLGKDESLDEFLRKYN